MDTSGTGHDRCPSPGPGPWGAQTPPSGGSEKISKAVFGFKRSSKNFFGGCRRSSDAVLAIRFINKMLSLRSKAGCLARSYGLLGRSRADLAWCRTRVALAIFRPQPSSETGPIEAPRLGSCERVRFSRRGGRSPGREDDAFLRRRRRLVIQDIGWRIIVGYR
jgi:hypothetical protein